MWWQNCTNCVIVHNCNWQMSRLDLCCFFLTFGISTQSLRRQYSFKILLKIKHCTLSLQWKTKQQGKTFQSNPFWRYFKGNLKGFVRILSDKNPQKLKLSQSCQMWQFFLFTSGHSECKHTWAGRGKKREKEINGKTNIWEMTAYRRVKPEGGTANASQRHRDDSSSCSEITAACKQAEHNTTSTCESEKTYFQIVTCAFYLRQESDWRIRKTQSDLTSALNDS